MLMETKYERVMYMYVLSNSHALVLCCEIANMCNYQQALKRISKCV